MNCYGGQTSVGSVKHLLVKKIEDAWVSQGHCDAQWRALNYSAAPDFAQAQREYGHFLELLDGFDLQLYFLPPSTETGLDSIYAHDPLFLFDQGAVLMNMGKDLRSTEPAAMLNKLDSLGIPVAGKITGEGRMECGDLFWLDERTLVAGEGYRTNRRGIAQLREILGDAVDEIIAVPLPHWTGPDDCLHLLSIISPVDRDLAVVYSKLMPVPFRELLLARGIQLIEVPDDEYETMGCNVLPLAPRRCIVLEGNPRTRARLEAAGVEVLAYKGVEISRKGMGGPTCLTRPLQRVLD